MSRASTPAPLDSASWWRRLKAAVHPDRDGGDHDLFLFVSALEDHVRECLTGYGRSAPYGERFAGANTTTDEPERIAFDPILGFADEFVALTVRALSIGQDVGEPFGPVLSLLIDLPAHAQGRAVPRQSRGASYRQLARIAHTLGWSKEQRVRWYRIAEEIPLSCAHAGHIIARLGERRRAA